MAITSDSEHMRLFLSRGNGANDLQSGGINYGDCLFKLGRHVEQTVLRAEQRTMRADALAEINIADNLAGCKIDHHHVAAISAGHPHARVSIDGDVGEFAVAGGDHFVSCNAVFGNFGHLFSGRDVDQAERVVAFIGDEQRSFGSRGMHGTEAYQSEKDDDEMPQEHPGRKSHGEPP